MRMIDANKSLIDTDIKLFNKGFGIRVSNATSPNISTYLTAQGVKYYLGHKGEDISAYDGGNYKLPKNIYQVIMPFDSMTCIRLTNNSTNTFHLQGYDLAGNRYLLKIAHCKNIVVTVNQIVILNQVMATVSDTGVEASYDNSHAHMELSRNDILISFMEVVDEKIKIQAQQEKGSDRVRVVTEKGALYIRQAPGGKILATIPIHESAEIHLIDGIQSDGYQWAHVVYEGITGVCQIDTAYLYLHQE